MNLSAGKNPPEQVNVFIEIPQGSNIKYELDQASGAVLVDRFLYTAFSYPFNYGFIPQTKGQDGDPVDVLVLSSQAVGPGAVIPSQVIGMLEMEDEEGIDTKIIAVPTPKVDPFFGAWTSVDAVPQFLKDKIKHFFEHYKELEPGKWVKIRQWKGKAEALAVIQSSLK